MSLSPYSSLSFKDVCLIPNYSNVSSRNEIDTSIRMGDFKFDLPVIPSNMKSVIDYKTYRIYKEGGVIPVMHRFDDPVDYVMSNLSKESWKAVSVGVKEKDMKDLYICKNNKTEPDCVCIDIAHGHSLLMRIMIQFVRSLFKNTYIIAGNVTTPEAVKDLEEWGADSVKVGIGGGRVCSTRNKTGFHIPMFTAIKNCADVAKIPIIADGGFRENGDIAKALVAGATFCMVGSMFASCIDSPAEVVEGKKEYYGSASEKNKGHSRNIEGFITHLTPTTTISQKISEIKEDLQSAISYSGGHNLNALDLSKVNYTIVTN